MLHSFKDCSENYLRKNPTEQVLRVFFFEETLIYLDEVEIGWFCDVVLEHRFSKKTYKNGIHFFTKTKIEEKFKAIFL